MKSFPQPAQAFAFSLAERDVPTDGALLRIDGEEVRFVVEDDPLTLVAATKLAAATPRQATQEARRKFRT